MTQLYIEKIYQQINADYVDDVDPNQLMKTGIDAMLGSLDPYTNYISESQIESYRISSEGKYQGIGAVVKKIGDYVMHKEGIFARILTGEKCKLETLLKLHNRS